MSDGTLVVVTGVIPAPLPINVPGARYFFVGFLRAVDFAADFFFAVDFFAPALAVAADFVAFVDFAFFGLSPKILSQFFENSGVGPVRTIGPLVGMGTRSCQIRSNPVVKPMISFRRFCQTTNESQAPPVVLLPEILSTIINRPN